MRIEKLGLDTKHFDSDVIQNHAFTKSDGVLLWNNKEIVLQLEHINGVNNDNRPQNLCFLCPSCHSQTSTFTGRNSKKYRAGQAWFEEGKASHPPGSIASLLNYKKTSVIDMIKKPYPKHISTLA